MLWTQSSDPREEYMMEERKILSIKDLVVEYRTSEEQVQAVNGVSFDLNYGETIGLVGETGAGKTTIARAIMGILPDPPAKVRNGSIRLDDRELLSLSNEEMQHIRGNRISMVFQDPMTALNPVIRVGRQIAEGIKIHEKISWYEAEKKAMEIFEMVGIPATRFREYPHQFSGGMKQRVVIAIALACNPDLLIADEPTTALDVTIQAQVLEMISDLQKKKNSAMILITHDFGVVAKTCDKVAAIYGGQIIEYGTKRQIFQDCRHPYTLGLFEAIPSLTSDVDRLNPIVGQPPDPTRLPKGCYFSPRCPYAADTCRKGQIPMFTLKDGHQCRCLRYEKEAVSKTDSVKLED